MGTACLIASDDTAVSVGLQHSACITVSQRKLHSKQYILWNEAIRSSSGRFGPMYYFLILSVVLCVSGKVLRKVS